MKSAAAQRERRLVEKEPKKYRTKDIRGKIENFQRTKKRGGESDSKTKAFPSFVLPHTSP
jgi:hypothetical protein